MNYKVSAEQIENLLNGLKEEVAKSDKGVQAAQIRYRRKLSEIIMLAKSLRAISLDGTVYGTVSSSGESSQDDEN